MSTLRIASVPHSQVYIRHCGPVPGDPVTFTRLPDPRPKRGDGTEQSGWWPPAMLEEGWIGEHADAFDLMHIHFGFDALGPADLERVVADLRRHGKPLVYTVHDLTNPHHTDPSAHAAALDVLVPAADALITLTPGAATEIARRWGRDALVLPHPHVVDLPELERRAATPRTPGSPLRLGVHLKSLRPNMAPQQVVEGLVAAAATVPDAVVQVNTHPEVIAGGGHQASAELGVRLRDLADAGAIDLQVRPYFAEDELWDYLASLDASVLPYRWGTHSGWLEACHDLGTPVIAPDCGFYAEQRPVHTFHLDTAGLDVDSLAATVQEVAALTSYAGAGVADRVAERRGVAAEHDRLYRSLVE
ncbi:glycosyltransferase family protein [Mariniluteicoccus flavus]